jgi:hypothetical protein
MYKIYAEKKIGGYDLISTTGTKTAINKIVNSIDKKIYRSYLIIERVNNGDQIIAREEFSKECKVELVNDLKVDFEVKTTTIVPEKDLNRNNKSYLWKKERDD